MTSTTHRPLLARPMLGLGAGIILLGLCALMVLGVGPQTARVAPATAFAPIGRLDQATFDAVQHGRNAFFTAVAKVLNFLGGGTFSIPFRIVAILALLFLRRFRHAIAFALTWLIAELSLTWLKAAVDRGRPPDPLVAVRGASFPSGHAVAGAAVGISLVIAFFPAGQRRRIWEWAAAGFAFLMGLSRVYLDAHWLSDAVAGVLLGAGVAITVAALVALTDRRIIGHTPHDEILTEGGAEPAPDLR